MEAFRDAITDRVVDVPGDQKHDHYEHDPADRLGEVVHGRMVTDASV